MRSLLLFAVVSAILYSCLVPLWEGFDEAFHYAYVQSLALERRFPVLGRTCVSAEIARSLELAPVSHVLHSAFPGTITFDQWFSLSAPERSRRRDAVAGLPPALRAEESPRRNYEAHQPPLAYAVLAPLDALASGAPLLRRVLLLRISGAVLCVAALFPALILLCRALGLAGPFRLAAMACVFLTQMLWATVAHVANDWLAIPVVTLLFALVVTVAREGRPRHAFVLALTLAAGLLTKAYFLAFVPVVAFMLFRKARIRVAVAALLACAALAGPWYARNWVLYHNLSGTQEAFEGIGPAAALRAVPQIAWPQTIGYTARSALWTGNNSFGTFSRTTLNIELLLVGAAWIAWAAKLRRAPCGERWLLAAVLLFCGAIAYATCTIWVHTKGASAGASPWYSVVLLPPLLAMAFFGLQRAGSAGRAAAIALVLINVWVCALTYTAKLFPLYGGFQAGKVTTGALWSWWLDPAKSAKLSSVALASAGALYVQLAVHTVLLGAVAVAVIKTLLYPGPSSRTISASEDS